MLAVEMEMSALFTVAQYRKVDLAGSWWCPTNYLP